MSVYISPSKPVYLTLLLAMGIALVFTARNVSAQETDKRTVTVTGEGIVQVEPDMAVVRFGVVTVADDPEAARSQNAEASSRTMNAVRNLGIEERHIRLETLRLQPHREWIDNLRRYEERGYEAVRIVVVEVHDLEMLPVLVAEIVQQGANRLESIQYDLDDRDAARNEAMREAVLNARAKAQLLAETLNEELGVVLSINEQSFDFPRPMYRAEMMQTASKDEAAPEPDAYAAGEIEVRVNVNATFALE